MMNRSHVNVGTIGHSDWEVPEDKSFMERMLHDPEPEENAQSESETDSDTYHSYGRGPGYGAKIASPHARKRLLAKRKAQRQARKKQRIKK